jgi:flagellar biosynthetic protein FliQ
VNVLDLWQSALMTAVETCAPFVVAALIVGLLTSVIQAATQLQENVLSFVPKLVAVGVVLAVAGPWVLGRLGQLTESAGQALVAIGHDGPR